jgi:hypothetical protein
MSGYQLLHGYTHTGNQQQVMAKHKSAYIMNGRQLGGDNETGRSGGTKKRNLSVCKGIRNTTYIKLSHSFIIFIF